MSTFSERILTPMERQALSQASRSEQVRINLTYWFEHELRQHPAVELDLGELRAHADRIVPLAGRASFGYPAHEASVELAKTLGRHLVETPGGHRGFLTDPAEVAGEVIRALERPGPQLAGELEEIRLLA